MEPAATSCASRVMISYSTARCFGAGDVANFTPLLRLSFLKDYVTGQLKNFEIIEGAYGIYWKAETSSADKKAALSSAAGSNDDTIIALLSKQGGILTQQNASFYEFLALAGQRSTANVALNAADTAFKETVNRARANMPSFLELLGLITSTVAQVGLDVAGVVKITGTPRCQIWSLCCTASLLLPACTHGI